MSCALPCSAGHAPHQARGTNRLTPAWRPCEKQRHAGLKTLASGQTRSFDSAPRQRGAPLRMTAKEETGFMRTRAPRSPIYPTPVILSEGEPWARSRLGESPSRSRRTWVFFREPSPPRKPPEPGVAALQKAAPCRFENARFRANKVLRLRTTPAWRSAQDDGERRNRLYAHTRPAVANTPPRARHPERRRAVGSLSPGRVAEPKSKDLGVFSGKPHLRENLPSPAWRPCEKQRHAGLKTLASGQTRSFDSAPRQRGAPLRMTAKEETGFMRTRAPRSPIYPTPVILSEGEPWARSRPGESPSRSRRTWVFFREPSPPRKPPEPGVAALQKAAPCRFENARFRANKVLRLRTTPAWPPLRMTAKEETGFMRTRAPRSPIPPPPRPSS